MPIKARTVLLAKVESTEGTDPSPVAADDAIEIMDLRLAFPPRVIDRPILSNTMSKRKPLHGGKYMEASFLCELKGSGTAGTAPDWLVLAEACGFDNTNVPATSDTLAPLSTGITSVTFYFYRDGLIYEMNGARGNMGIVLQAGDSPKLQFDFKGIVVPLIDGAIVSPTVDSTDPTVVKGATFTMGGFAAVIANLSMSLNAQVEMIESVNAGEGYARADIVDRLPAGSFDPEQVLVASNDYWSNWEDGTTQALSIVLGSSGGNIVTITAPVITYRELNEADRNGIMIHEIPFTLAESSGDDEISIALT